MICRQSNGIWLTIKNLCKYSIRVWNVSGTLYVLEIKEILPKALMFTETFISSSFSDRINKLMIFDGIEACASAREWDRKWECNEWMKEDAKVGWNSTIDNIIDIPNHIFVLDSVISLAHRHMWFEFLHCSISAPVSLFLSFFRFATSFHPAHSIARFFCMCVRLSTKLSV